MAWASKKPLAGGKYRAGFTDWRSRQTAFIGTTSRAETLAAAKKLENEHKLIRLGVMPPPKTSDTARPFAETVAEYLAHGRAQGGRGGRPWSETHSRMRQAHLEFWQKELGLQTIQDVSLPKVEATARELLKKRTPKTAANIAEALRALCLWAKRRGYLAENPLENMQGFDTTPQTIRRALTADEIRRFLDATPERRRLLYETALGSGLRAGELRALRVADLDAERCGLRLSASWTKNRKAGFQPISQALCAKLVAAVGGKGPGEALFFVATCPDEAFNRDLQRAGIPKHAPGGKLDFHALRTAYVTLVLESGADIKTAQTLARHSTAILTLNTYGRARPERLALAAESLGAFLRREEPESQQALRTGTDDMPIKTDEITAIRLHEQNAGSDKALSEKAFNERALRVQVPPSALLLVDEKNVNQASMLRTDEI